MTQPIPQGFHSVNVSLTLKDSAKALEFYKKAFSAKVLTVMPNLNGKGVMHATMQIGDSIVMMGDEGMGGCKSAETLRDTPVTFYIYTENADALFNQAVKAGAVAAMPMSDAFWGDRWGQVEDPFGYKWSIATQKRVLSPEEIRKGAEAFFAAMAKK